MVSQESIDAVRDDPVPAQKLLVAGAWKEGEKEPIAVCSPIDGKQLTTISHAGPRDVDAAVSSARRAFESGCWRRMPPSSRKAVLHRLADLLESETLPLSVLGVRDNGTEIGMALKAEVGSACATFRYYAEAIDKVAGEVAPSPDNILALVHREPVGVVGAIVPWNFPLMIGAWKLAPALAAGNSVVLKPSESASLSLLRLSGLAVEAGIPEGVLNVVTGPGRDVGAALALSPEVDVLAFTGSGTIGRRLLECAARSNLKRVYLELGGKSPNIVFSDAPDIRHAAKASASAIFRNSGQVCIAGSRLLVQDEIHDEFLECLVDCADALVVGDPLDLGSNIGAVNSLTQLDTILSFVRGAEAAGVRCVLGGQRMLENTGGYYMAPTIFDDVSPSSPLAQEEVFGPVLSVMRFKTEDEAVKLANSTEFGLAAGVWTSNLARAHRMVGAIRSGVVHVNTYGGSSLSVPLGGHRQSGNGYDKSLHSLDKYVNLKTAWIQL